MGNRKQMFRIQPHCLLKLFEDKTVSSEDQLRDQSNLFSMFSEKHKYIFVHQFIADHSQSPTILPDRSEMILT